MGSQIRMAPESKAAREIVGPGITFTELLKYTEQETKRWKQWFAAHPEALDRPCDVAKVGSIRGLLLHIFATELHFAHTVLDLPQPDWQKLPAQTVDELFALSEDALRKFLEFLDKAQPGDWDKMKDLGHGNLKASKRKIVAQALLHGIHHRGQLATLLRQLGFDGTWIHDLILTDVMP
ncbi:MAG TPA: DinB family protein [Terriglobales bacterium]|nr:DinB family protein [Terriglobales bacterium]